MPEIKADGGGRKFDFKDKKTRLDLIDPNFVEGIGKVMTYGAEKYDAHNWMRGMDFSRLIGGLERHTRDLKLQLDDDPETEILHLYHIGCCAMFLAHFLEHPEKYAKFDDRVFTPSTRAAFYEEQKKKTRRKSAGRRKTAKEGKTTEKKEGTGEKA